MNSHFSTIFGKNTDLSQYKKTILPNGIKVISETIPYVKSFSLGFWFNVGSRDETIKNNGITHFIEHMLFKGTQTRSAKKIADEIETCGGYLNAFTSKEHTCYYGRGPGSNISKTFEVLADMVQNPAFKPNEIKKEAGVVIDELNDINDNPEELIFDKFEEIIFPGSSLSLPIIGTANNIKNFNQFDLFNFVKQKYGFNRMLIAASGAVEHEELLKLCEKYIKKDLGNSSIRRKQYPAVNIPAKLEFIEKEIQQVHAIIGRPAYGFNSESRIKAAVLSQVLGEGSSSRLFQSLRERNGITYQVNSFLNSFYDTSAFGVYFSTNEKMTDRALDLVYREIKKLKEKKISARELNRAKESMKGSMLLSLESTSSRMTRMAQSEFYFNRIKSTDEMIKNIDAVSADDVLETANKLLEENSFIRLIIKSKNTLLKSAA